MKKLIDKFLRYFDIKIVINSKLEALLFERDSLALDINLAKLIDPQLCEKYVENLNFSKSQLRQDLFVLSELGFKREGFFVEFGAANGIKNSNSYLLETKFSWDGILAEPAKIWHRDLLNNRSVNIETDCVWKATGEKLIFNEIFKSAQLSSLNYFSNYKRGKKYEVNTISLEDLLDKFDAPKVIDYLSIDTEGSEFEILNSFNFKKYKFKILTCEHNYNSNRDHIHNLLINNGYKRKFVKTSLWEDWYVLCE